MSYKKTNDGLQRSNSTKFRHYNNFIGEFQDNTIKQQFDLIERNFELKKNYGERDWLNKNKNEVPQSFN